MLLVQLDLLRLGLIVIDLGLLLVLLSLLLGLRPGKRDAAHYVTG